MPVPTTSTHISGLLAELKELRESCLAMEQEFGASIAEACPQSRRSVENFLHYLALRKHDLRDLQSRLAALGLSSLGRSESSVLAGLEAVIAILESLAGAHVRSSAAGALRRLHDRSRCPGRAGRPSSGTGPHRPRGSNHGHHAFGSRPVLRTGQKPGRGRHGRDARELRARFGDRMGSA